MCVCVCVRESRVWHNISGTRTRTLNPQIVEFYYLRSLSTLFKVVRFELKWFVFAEKFFFFVGKCLSMFLFYET